MSFQQEDSQADHGGMGPDARGTGMQPGTVTAQRLLSEHSGWADEGKESWAPLTLITGQHPEEQLNHPP